MADNFAVFSMLSRIRYPLKKGIKYGMRMGCVQKVKVGRMKNEEGRDEMMMMTDDDMMILLLYYILINTPHTTVLIAQ